MKLLTLLLTGLSAVVLCSGTDPARIVPDEFCSMGCVQGDCIADHGTFECRCQGNWYGENCTQHICDVQTLCQNGGTCAPNPHNVSDYICSCPIGLAGRNCQYLIYGTACSTNPCGENGVNGTCYNLAAGGYECICNPGHYGQNCSQPTNDLCLKDGVEDCFGHGICTILYRVDGNLFPNCSCFPEYEVTSKCRLTNYYNVCSNEYPCQNGGKCNDFDGNLNGGTFYTCDCPFNYAGVNCTEPYDICDPSPCENGGVCSPIYGGHYHQCSCPENYGGYNCEFLVDPCLNEGSCGAGETCFINSAPESSGLYNISLVQTECLTCGGGSHDHCSSAPCGSHGNCTSTLYSYVCECALGYTGTNCSVRDHCARSPCPSERSTGCFNLPQMDSFVCQCLDGWEGNLCNQDINECLVSGTNLCNGGTCVNTPGGYRCENCPLNMTGPSCGELLTCDNTPCLNGGSCSDQGGVVSCNCTSGFIGARCQIETCPLQEHCANVSGNGICDYDCYTASCHFDGGDSCTLNPLPTNPWANCSQSQVCRQSFKDGVCDVQCNTAECFYDGGDCQPSCPLKDRCELGINDGQCTAECNTQECPFDQIDCKEKPNFLQDELVLILVSSMELPFSGDFREDFLNQLGRLTNTVPSVIQSKVITKAEAETLSENYPINLEIIYSTTSSALIYFVRLRLDVQLCRTGCPTSTEDVVNTIEAYFENGNVNIGVFEPAAAYSQPPPAPDTGGTSPTVIGVVSGLVVLVVCVVVIVGILLGKRKIQAKIWRPHSPASESDSGSTTQGGDGRRRNSQAGGAVTGTEPSLQHSDSDSFMEKGAKKAKMMADSSVEYEAVDGRYEVAHDSRKWNPAHYEALRNPRRVHELLVGYKRQHSDTFNVNAAGPGGFTPLMLVVMKRHSSHESIPGYNSRPSSISSEQAYASFYAPYHDRAALMNGAAAGGRPISNGSILSRDSCFYPPHGFVHPVDSSVNTLIKANVDLNATNDFGQTALQLAAACSRADYVEQLLEAGANPNITDNWGQSSLQVAIGAGAEGSFMILLNHPKTDLNQKSDGGITPLMAAVKVVNQYMLKMLIKKNADIAATDNDGRTALHWAAMVDNLEALKLLIRHGPETIKDAQDNKGQTALFLACREGSYGCVKHLIDCFANATLLDNLDQSPVHIAMQKQHLDIVALLQTQGPISYPPRVNLPYRPPAGAHLDQEQLYQQYQATSRPLIKPFKSKSRQDHRNLADHSIQLPYMSDLQRQQQSHEMSYFGAGGMQPTSAPQQTFGDIAHMPISTDPSSIPLSVLGRSSYSSGAAAAVASVSSVTSAVDGGSPPTCMGGNSVVNTHPVMANYLLSNSEQSHPLQQSTTPPSSAQYASPPSSGYGNHSPGYDGELTDYMGGTEIPSTSSSAGVAISQSLSPQSYNNHLPSSSSALSPSQQLPAYSGGYSGAAYSQVDRHNAPPPVSMYATNNGSTRPLQHLSFVPEVSMSNQLSTSGAPPTLAMSEHHTSPPHMGSVSSGSPSSAYPSPGNELGTNYISHGYMYSSSARTSPPSLTPSPESREEQMVNAHGTFHIEHHPHDYPSCHTHIPPDSGMTMV